MTPRQTKTLQQLKKVLASETVRGGNLAMIDHLYELEEQVDDLESKFESSVEEVKGMLPKVDDIVAQLKGEKGEPGEVDEDKIVASVLGKIPPSEKGKDADETKIVAKVLKKLPKPESIDYDGMLERVLSEIPTPEPAEPLRASEIRDMLETLPEEERIRKSALLGGDDLVDREELNRAIEILDKRTQYLINKQTSLTLTTNGTSGAATYSGGILNIPQYPGSSGFTVLPATGTVDNSNTVFTFTSTPTIVFVNGTGYRNGYGVTIASLTATLNNPVGTGGDIYAI